MSQGFRVLIALAFACAGPAMAQVPDSLSLELGAGKATQMVRVAAQWDWERRWFETEGAQLGGYWNVSAGAWRLTRFQGIPGRHERMADVGITPVFRYAASGKSGPYAEAAIGIHLLSDLYDNGGHKLATHFQFGDHLAVGYRFAQGWDASLKLQHFSNGGIKHPNGGVNFFVLRVAKHF
jgi:lipid A 3-O-deacylase